MPTTNLADQVRMLNEHINNLVARIESAKKDNESTREKISDCLRENDAVALPAALDDYIEAKVKAHISQHRLQCVEEKIAMKEDILLPIKTRKCEWANDKNCERKNLLSILKIGLNVPEVGPEYARIEFVVNSRKILTNYNVEDETFTLISVEPKLKEDILVGMQKLLKDTNDICGMLSAAKTVL